MICMHGGKYPFDLVRAAAGAIGIVISCIDLCQRAIGKHAVGGIGQIGGKRLGPAMLAAQCQHLDQRRHGFCHGAAVLVAQRCEIERAPARQEQCGRGLDIACRIEQDCTQLVEHFGLGKEGRQVVARITRHVRPSAFGTKSQQRPAYEARHLSAPARRRPQMLAQRFMEQAIYGLAALIGFDD